MAVTIFVVTYCNHPRVRRNSRRCMEITYIREDFVMFTECKLEYIIYSSNLRLGSEALHRCGRRAIYLLGMICRDQINTSNSPHHHHRRVAGCTRNLSLMANHSFTGTLQLIKEQEKSPDRTLRVPCCSSCIGLRMSSFMVWISIPAQWVSEATVSMQK